MSVKKMYKQLAVDTFQHQWINDIEDVERLLAVCIEEIEKAGYPCTDENEDDWLEYVYEATDIWRIARDGFTYRREKNADKPQGVEFVLYTRANHPAFADD